MSAKATSQIPARRRRSMLARRDIRTAERELRRATGRLSAFLVNTWPGGEREQCSYLEFVRTRNRLVFELRAARLKLQCLTGQVQ